MAPKKTEKIPESTLPFTTYIISAGHSLSDPGAVSRVSTGDPSGSTKEVTESSLNILYRDSLVEYLRNTLQKRVVTPVDTFSLKQTLEYAKMFPEGTLAVELHFNSASNPEASGIEVFYHGGNKRCQQIANRVSEGISKVLFQKNRGAKPSERSARGRLGFVDDLRDAILIEIGFMSNEEELWKFLKLDNRNLWARTCGDLLVL